eukprot:gnl/Spiro4/22022_TR10826_c0_g1_i1.p1 gnl/Spiro4/22022_TR10826_c0_g1~~gnl/Spiro4/22022_TR10826_c0_g1_i1.p1  ORF type:complete len:426 (+),score=116.20 gnl/Spiro4/22022_TR10826_c0_g1_i1:89-1279(+)
MDALMDHVDQHLEKLQSDKKNESEKPVDSDFKQQRVPAWQPLLTPNVAISTLATVGVLFLAIGITIIYVNNSLHEEVVRYDDLKGCHMGATCSISLANQSFARSLWTGPVYVYYQLENFYQNHRQYVHSRSPKQLAGDFTYHKNPEPGEDVDSFSECKPLECKEGTGGDNQPPCEVLYPCGLIAQSFFTDDLKITNDLKNNQEVAVSTLDIAWASDKDQLFKPPQGDKPDFDVTQERFIAWMRVAGLPKFRKLWGRIDQPFEKSNYTLTVKNQFDTSEFKGKKYVIFATMGTLGGRNTFLSFSFMVGAVLCILFSIFFAVQNRRSNRTLGDFERLGKDEGWVVDWADHREENERKKLAEIEARSSHLQHGGGGAGGAAPSSGGAPPPSSSSSSGKK